MTMQPNSALTLRRAPAGRAGRIGPGRRGVFAALRSWHTRRRDLRHLMELDDHLLRDIGLSRAEVHRAALQAFWKV